MALKLTDPSELGAITATGAISAPNLQIDDYIYHKDDTHTYFGFSGNDAFAMAFEGTTRLSVADSTDPVFTYNAHINMSNKDIDYVNQLHFGSNVRFYDEGNDSYLNFKFGDTSFGGIKMIDGSGNVHGYFYADGDDSIGILDNDGSWAVQVDGDVLTALKVNDVYRVKATMSGVELNGATTVAGNITANQFVDAQDTAFYANPAATSILRRTVGTRRNLATSEAWSETDAWNVGTQTGYFGGSFTINGASDENNIAYEIGPGSTHASGHGNRCLVWKITTNSSSSGADGGWNKTITNINPYMGHMSVIYVKRVASGNGNFYHGTSTCLNISDGSSNGNPYFTSGASQSLPSGVWCVSIGYLQAANDTAVTSSSSFSGIYRLDTGERIIGNTDYRMSSGTTTTQHRTFLYYSTNTDTELWLAKPGFYEINGSEPTINELLMRPEDRVDSLRADNDMRAPIYYDSNDTGYFLNPSASGGNALKTIGDWRQTTDTWSGEVGGKMQYHGNHWYLQAGGYVHFRNTSGANTFYVDSAGTGVISNYLTGTNSLRAPIFYDSGDTNYFTHPGDTSQMRAISIMQGSGLNLYQSGNASYCYQDGRAEGSYTAVYKGTNNGSGYGPYREYWYDGDSYHSLQISGNRWNFNAPVTASTDMRAPLFYDTDNTSYYVNPASSSQMGTIDFNGVVSGTASGAAQIGRNHAYDTVELKGYGAELMIGAQNAGIHINYRTCNNGASGHTPTTWYWRAGSATSWSTHNFGAVTSNGVLTGTTDVRGPLFYDTGNTAYYLDPGHSSTSLSTSGKWFMQGSHGACRFQLNYQHSSTDDANSGTLTGWASEPGITYNDAGIGGNVNVSGQYYGRQYNSGYGVYVNFKKSNGQLEHWTTTGNAGTAGGQGTRQWYNDASGNSFATTSSRAPIFYDSNDTTYFVNPAGTGDSSIYAAGGIKTNEWLRVNTSSTGVYWHGTGHHIYPSSSSSMWLRSGHTSASEWKLSCASETSRGSLYANSSNQIGFLDGDGNWAIRHTKDSTTEFLSNDVVKFTIASNGDCTAVGDVVAYSDIKLKKNIKTLDGSKVYDMRGVSFTRKDTEKDGSGVIAQEIQKIAPELITKTDDTLGVSYGNITGYLIEAIKDLKAEVEELKKQIK